MIELAWPAFLLILVVVSTGVGAACYVAAYARARLRFEGPSTYAQAESQVLRERLVDLAASDEREHARATQLAPLESALARMERQVSTLERDRSAQFGQLGERLTEVAHATSGLRTQTAQLAGSLNASTVRGSWGEAQLRRVLEHGGLLPRCDFDEQAVAHTRAGATVRPDVVVRLPEGKTLIIDAKAPMSAFLAAQAGDLAPQARAEHLREHATQLRRHVNTLAAKEYWTAFADTPEMVVCFVPGDAMLATALDGDPALYEDAMARKVVLASPATLHALTRTVAHVWRQDSLTRNARELLTLGTELHARIGTMSGHLTRMGASLRKTVDTYNSLVATVETRVLVTARKMESLGIADQTPPVSALDATVRPLTAPELVESLPSSHREPSSEPSQIPLTG